MGSEDPSRNRDTPARRGIVVAKGFDRHEQERYREQWHPVFSEEPYRYAVVLDERGSVSAPKTTIHFFNRHNKVIYAENAKILGDLGILFSESPWSRAPSQVYWFVPDFGEHPEATLKSLCRIWVDNRSGTTAYPYIPYHKRTEQVFEEWDLQQWDAWLRWFLSWMDFRNPIPKATKETCLAAYAPTTTLGGDHPSPDRLRAVYIVVPYLPEAWILKNHPPYIKECKFCKQPIINMDPRREYCDEACKNKAYRDKKKRNGKIIRRVSCIHCGELLQNKRGGAKFCSDRCRQAYHRSHRKKS